MDHSQLIDPPLPRRFAVVGFERAWTFSRPREMVWAWLSDPRTFTRGVIPPFGVEFLDTPDAAGFEEGVLNAHHGPFMSFHGVMGEVRPPEFRDLRYSYGSYALSLRLVRPTRLRFWFDEVEGGRCRVRLRLDAQVRRGFRTLWRGLNAFFWWNFGLSARIVLALRQR